MDYRLRHKKAELESTCYMEIGPGTYAGLHWQDGFVFVRDDAFGVAEGIVERHFPNYGHIYMNDIPQAVARKIIADWRAVADRLPNLDRSTIQRDMNLSAARFADLPNEIESDRLEVAGFLRSLADECENFLRQNDWMCILGM
jgi:hypothetical protein